ncbi:MAG: hypothetical protein KA099_05395 [Alphaproteobacteria bacterium]|nr:hypothetical protein [Alphaproteobacteria bacterium]MBP7759855.1 hypothetical protein [Alphaproteobacteria bacterium]MBP7763175.1 hypothetical protein [Alphaproteobacteria bacterium]MBP7904747.1 hypothetical protein [Alphaproteobacteria bacterium]
MSEEFHKFDSVSEIGALDTLLAQAVPHKSGKGNSITISLPASEKAAFEAALDTHNQGIVRGTNVPALVAKLQTLAADHYVQEEDGSFSVAHPSAPADRPTFASFREALLDAKEKEQISPGNLTLLKFMMAAEETDQAIGIADAHTQIHGYTDFSYLGSGTFTIAFRAREQDTGRSRIVKFSGWGGELQAKGASIPDNIKPALDSPSNLPEDWYLFAFPEVVPLEKVADELGRGTRIEVTYREPDGKETPEFYKTHGTIDIVHAMFVNSMSEGYFPSDTVEGNTALMPDGGLKAFDMGMIAHKDNASLNPFDPEAAAKHDAEFGALGVPFHHLDHNGVPTDIAAFQPERYRQFVRNDFRQDMRAEMA